MKLIYKIALPLIVAYFICLSFIRYYNLPLDGDLPAIVLPVESYELVLKDPFGLTVLLNDSVYAATNRFFTHFLSNHILELLRLSYKIFLLLWIVCIIHVPSLKR
nr:hypothetical protein [Bacteroidota bacterium]